jgi:hypothetical protein
MFRDEICAFLESEGHATATTINEQDTDYAYIGFRSRGLSLMVHSIEGDPGFLHIVAKVEMPLRRVGELTVRRVLMAVQHQRKNVKCSVNMDREYVTFHAEQFVTQEPGTPEFRRVFWRAVDVIEEALRDVRRELRALDTPKAAAERFIAEIAATLQADGADGRGTIDGRSPG